MDQGLFACFGRWAGAEVLPYRDMWDSKPPLALYTYPLAFALFGPHTGAIWLFEALWLAASMAAAFLLGRAAGGRGRGTLAAAFLLALLWSPGWGGYWSRAQAEEFLALPVIAAGWAALRTSRRTGAAFACGLMTGVAGLYKLPALALLAAWPCGWAVGRQPRRFAVLVLLMVAGAAVPLAAAAAWFAAHGAAGELWRAAVVYNRHYAAVIGGGSSWADLFPRFARTLFRAAPVAALAGPFGAALLLVRDPVRGVWLASWQLLSAAAVLGQRQLAGYHFLLLAPPLALGAAHGIAALAEAVRGAEGRRRWLAGAGLAGLALLGISSARAWATSYGLDAEAAAGKLPRVSYLRRLESGPFSPADEEAAAAYVAARTAPEDGILVWGLSPGVYFLSGRHPVTRFPFHHLLLTDAPLSRRFGSYRERRRAFLERLRRDPPAYILVGTGDRNGFEPEDSWRQLLRFPELRRIVFRDYVEERRIGRFRVFARKRDVDGGGPADE
ncbi:MAG: hypothetical protein D6718_00575 [Acidobacteria bacterium]|nr:MAG: hypothetical protein D6718_00575 [Acidobacteriota bacterium]